MGHELKPRGGDQLSASEVARRLAESFRYVKADAKDGLKQAVSRADWIEHAPVGLFLGHHQQALEFAARLRNVKSGDALTIEFGDDATKKIKIIVIPEESIKFGYSSKEEEVASRDLVERCAGVLNCEIVVF